MRTHVLTLALIAATAGIGSPPICQAAQATSDITIAAIAAGRLYVVGTTERPHTSVSLDSRFTTVSDDGGKFQYELVYHPARCIVAAEIEGKTYEAVVSNCGQQGPAGPPASAVRAPIAAAAVPSRLAGSKDSDVVAEPRHTGALLARSAASAEPKPRRSMPSTAAYTKRAPTLARAPVHRVAMRPAPSRPHKPAVREQVEPQELDASEAPPED